MIKILSTLFSRYSIYLVGSLLITNFITYQFLTSAKKDVQLCEIMSEYQDQAITAIGVEYDKALKNRKIITVEDVKESLSIRSVDRNITMKECHETASVIDAIRRSGL